jgi:hypothetical protein
MKFSIRDLFLVTLIVALAMGWWVDRSKLRDDARTWKQRADGVTRELSRLGYEVQWLDSQDIVLSITHPVEKVLPTSSAPAPNPPKP